jgi:hypothetical protein
MDIMVQRSREHFENLKCRETVAKVLWFEHGELINVYRMVLVVAQHGVV